jgi:hypothetical protein
MPLDDTDDLLRRLLAERLVQPVRLGRLRCWLLTPAAQDRLTELDEGEGEGDGAGWPGALGARVPASSGVPPSSGALSTTALSGVTATTRRLRSRPSLRRTGTAAQQGAFEDGANLDDEATRTLTLALPEPIVAPPPRRRRLLPPLALAAGALAVVGLLVAGATGELSTGGHRATPPSTTGPAGPAFVTVTNTGSATGRYAVAAPQAVVTVAADAPCWVEASPAPGATPLFEGLLDGGQSKAFRLTGSLVVDVGSSGCRLTVAAGKRNSGALAPPVAPYEFRFVTTGG